MDVDTRSVIRTLKEHGNHRVVRSLLTNKANKNIVFANGAFHFIDANGRYNLFKGLLPVLKANFWSTTNMNNIMRKPKINKSTKKRNIAPLAVAPSSKGKGRFFGSVQGSRVHGELEDFILLDDKNFLKKHGVLHPWTKRILIHIICQMGCYPVECEFPVYDEALGIATKMDMIGVNPANGNLVFFEFKTGYNGYFENSDGFMSKSLSTMPNSPLNWANIQLTASVVMLLRLHTNIQLQNTSSYVIRVDDNNLDTYKIDNKFIHMMNPRLLNDIVIPVNHKK